jgi:cytochrome P450
VQRKTEVQDIAAALIEDEKTSSYPEVSRHWLTGDSRILIVAGSDAVASSLVFAFYYLAQDARHGDAIQSELANMTSESNWGATALQTQAPYLTAFILEVLRLWPPNPSGVLRQTPKEGLMVGDRLIPGDITTCTPFWALHRCKTAYIIWYLQRTDIATSPEVFRAATRISSRAMAHPP